MTKIVVMQIEGKTINMFSNDIVSGYVTFGRKYIKMKMIDLP